MDVFTLDLWSSLKLFTNPIAWMVEINLIKCIKPKSWLLTLGRGGDAEWCWLVNLERRSTATIWNNALNFSLRWKLWTVHNSYVYIVQFTCRMSDFRVKQFQSLLLKLLISPKFYKMASEFVFSHNATEVHICCFWCFMSAKSCHLQLTNYM